jgi:hypothetical protein
VSRGEPEVNAFKIKNFPQSMVFTYTAFQIIVVIYIFLKREFRDHALKLLAKERISSLDLISEISGWIYASVIY